MTGVRLDFMDGTDNRGYSSAPPLAEGQVSHVDVLIMYLEV